MSNTFNAIAAVINSKSGTLYQPLVRFGLIVGLLWATVAMVYGDKAKFIHNWLIPFYLALALFFAPTCKVHIFDPVTGYRFTVDNVPWGLGMVAGSISQIGNTITQEIEKTFSLPDDLKHHKTGAVMASNLIVSARTFHITNTDLVETMRSFVNQCVFFDALMGRKYTLDDLRNSPDIWQLAMEKPSPARCFSYKEHGHGKIPEIVTCQRGALLLNPFDYRSQNWNPWTECLNDAHFDTLAAAIIPKTSHTEPFWENAGKSLLSAALKKLAREKDVEQLYHVLVHADLSEFSKFFRHTEAATYTHTEGEKMTLSIRATLANHLQSFRLLKNAEEGFSIRKWIADESNLDPWLFLSARPDQRETLRPLLSGWLDTALNALMSLSPEPHSRKLWFVVDELPSLQKLPFLETGLAEARKYGGCILAGIQSVPQLATTYGHTQSQAILDLFNTKIFFRNTDPHTTSWISKVLGEAETTEQIENLSYGANTIRDGVNLAQQTRTKPLVLPAEISTLKDYEAYLKLPNPFPLTKIQMTYKNLPKIAEAFELICEKEP